MRTLFVEIVPRQRVVVEHISESHHFIVTITLEAGESNTLVRWQQVFDTVEHENAIGHIVVEANEQDLERLEAEVRNVQRRSGA